MISLDAKNLESELLAEPHVAVMFSCRTLTRSAKVSCRTLQIAEPKALNSEKDYLAEPWNAGSFAKCPSMQFEIAIRETTKDPEVEGSRSYQISVAPLFRSAKVLKTLALLCSSAIREGRMIRDRSLLTS